MIGIQRDSSSRLLKSYLPPFKGTWNTLPSHLLPDDVLKSSQNVSLLNGILRSRCGLLLQANSAFDDNIQGSFMFIDSASEKIPLASSKTTCYRYVNSGWIPIPASYTLAGIDQKPIRFTSIQQGSAIYFFLANGNQELAVNFESTGVLVPITSQGLQAGSGPVPILHDVCTSFDRIIGITPPYTITWCEAVNNSFLGWTKWPTLNQAILSQTEDALVAIRSLGTLNLAVYKEGNIFIGLAQGGPSSSAFRFDHYGEFEGPANCNAIVNANGLQIRMTPTGRIGAFNGNTHEWICDGLWPFLRDDIDPSFLYKIHGVFNYQTNEVTFWYPKQGDNGLVQGMLVINLPYPTAGISTYSYFIGQTLFSITNGLSVRLFNTLTSPIVFGSTARGLRAFTVSKDTYTDDDYPFPCSLQTGLFKPEDDPQSLTDKGTSGIYKGILELYTTRDSGRGSLELSLLTSNQLESDGTEAVSETVDLTQTFPDEYYGYEETGSFLGVKVSWNSDAQVEYKGCDVYGRKVN